MIPIRSRTGRAGCCALLLVAACLLAAPALAQGVRAWLDRTTMQLGESVTLNVETQGGNGASPDFSALKQDFDLVGTQSSQQLSIVNGRSLSKTLWAVGLEPKHQGHITIGPLTVGGEKTAPIELDVLAPAVATAKAGADVFLEVSAEPLDPYVQQQVRYAVKLYYAFDLTDGNLGEPQADGLDVKRLGQDKSYVATFGGRRYHVIERHYALTPEHSGPIDIAPLVFRGTAIDGGDPTGFFSRGRGVGASSDAVHLDVRKKPSQWTGGNWLPAAALLLKDESALPDEVHVGDPVTRTIRLQAKGLGYEQLPEPSLDAPRGAEVYPDKTDARTRDDGEWLYGERVRKFAFVPNQVGSVTIPGLTVHWWDTVNDRAETSELPPKTIRVLAAADDPSSSASSSPASAPATPVAAAPAAATNIPAGVHGGPGSAQRVFVWQALAVAGFALWLLTLAWWWHSRRAGTARGVPDRAPPEPDGLPHRAAFLRACSLGEFAGAERALVAWARGERPGVRNLGELAARLDGADQREALAELQRVRYAGTSAHGLATRLQHAFARGLAWQATTAAHGAADALPSLYPPRD